MLDSFRFVVGAVAKKDFVPVLQHFRIEGGTIRGYNGAMGLCCPIDLNLNVCPKALPLIKAVQTCKDTIAIHQTASGRLSIKSGGFKALIDCIDESFPEMTPEGTIVKLKGELLAVLKKLTPFIAEDASRPWARGILLKEQSAFATNNVCLVEYWLGYDFPVAINIPKTAVTELLRIGEEPTKLQWSENNVTFHFAGDRWLRTQTYSTEWPDLAPILNAPAVLTSFPDEFWPALEALIPFADENGRVYFKQNAIATGATDDAMAAHEVLGVAEGPCFNIKQLRLLQDVADLVSFETFPKPCAFSGDRLRGAIVGMRV